jgi:NAD(P)H-flavin reductase
LLIGTGSGLAPLYGIARAALYQGHTGPVRLFHGSRHRGGLYLIDELNELGAEFSNFDFIPCVSGPDVPHGYTSGRPSDVALQELPDPKGWRIFLCGHPDMVAMTRKKAFLAGATMKDIYADAFRVGSNL